MACMRQCHSVLMVCMSVCRCGWIHASAVWLQEEVALVCAEDASLEAQLAIARADITEARKMAHATMLMYQSNREKIQRTHSATVADLSAKLEALQSDISWYQGELAYYQGLAQEELDPLPADF